MKFRNIFLVLMVLLSGTACEEALRVSDPESLSPDDVLDKVAGFESVVLSAYNRIHRFGWMGQNGIVAPEIMADNLDFNNRTGRYEQHYVNAVRTHMGRWGNFVGINDCNIIISRIDDLKDIPSDDLALRDQVKGEALFIRALNYHDMAKVYGYEPGQEVNGFNLTVPLRTSETKGVSDALDVKPRATNTELYTQIKADLNSAISLLPASNGSGPFRIGQDAAHALLARVLLYEGSWAEAAAQAELALSKTGASLIEDKAAYYDSWFAVPHPESLYEAEIRSTDWSTVDGANNSLSTLSNNTSSSSQFILVGSPELMAVLDSEVGDMRDTIWDASASGIPAGTRKCQKWQGEKGDFLENIPMIRYSEVLLIAAEGYAKSGNAGQAQEHLNRFRAARGLPATDLTGTDLEALIMKERRLEFALEGHRWFDLKRNGMDIPKSAASGVPTVSYSDFRLLGVIPQTELSLNEFLVQNPGYN
ncbi:MAG: RagB/SusD family nutrient uptake outer membrane protein [Saprospiraceae bacterium]|nr:RagB/SusD family nutrient uptake outer membrane protein [Saprospiraceae bacterium]